jgi:hypothetical protein
VSHSPKQSGRSAHFSCARACVCFSLCTRRGDVPLMLMYKTYCLAPRALCAPRRVRRVTPSENRVDIHILVDLQRLVRLAVAPHWPRAPLLLLIVEKYTHGPPPNPSLYCVMACMVRRFSMCSRVKRTSAILSFPECRGILAITFCITFLIFGDLSFPTFDCTQSFPTFDSLPRST